MESTMHRMFVYGTLMRGEPNHRLLAAARFLGAAKTAPGYRLFDLGACPAMTTGDQAVDGELFEVDAETLARIDRLEGHPTYYVRLAILLEDGRRAHAYLMPEIEFGRHPVIPGGAWRTRSRRAR
jgi:gamma-glutamylcyclotransferase (GGCT)/AIG2-like uncharacterized protein YtfP